jgi:DNA-binding MarR family transcriptional regulator
MPPSDGLSPNEEALWRATMRIVIILPLYLDTDMIRGAGITASEFATLMSLSETSDHELRMTDLAKANRLSASRTTRLVYDLERRGLVEKVASSADARSTRARITSNGLAKLTSARQSHLESVRHRFLDHVDASTVGELAYILSTVACHLDDPPRRKTL